jgi:hypothetical protein
MDSSASSSDVVAMIKKEVTEQNALQGAKTMFRVSHNSLSLPAPLCLGSNPILTAVPCQFINANCYDRCIASSGTSASSSESSCLKTCLDKYFGAYNVVAREMMGHLKKPNGMQIVALTAAE